MQKEMVEVATKYESVAAWSKRSGMKTGAIYARLASGDLRAIKVGRRTLIDVQHGLEWLETNRWKPSGPAAKRGASR